MEVTVKFNDRHKEVLCDICGKPMRSNNLKRHILIHKDLLSLTDDVIKEELEARHTIKKEKEIKKQRIEEIARENGYDIPDEIRKPIDDVAIEQLERDLLQDNKIYLNKIELGRKISIVIEKGVVQEESLTKERQEALKLYRKRKPRFDIATTVLRSWQEQALELFETPTERSIIWICGRKGDEGKSWFQSYIQGHYGFNRVVRLDLRIKHGNLCNVLKKQSLSSVDIFLFNDARSVTGEDYNLYRILEDLKDGQATASKYDNDNIHFKTPNTVVIFSNQLPNVKKLSKDRWIIFEIKQNELNNITKTVSKGKQREEKEGQWEYDVKRQNNEMQDDEMIDDYKGRVSDYNSDYKGRASDYDSDCS